MIEASDYTFDLWQLFFGDFSFYIYLEILIRVAIIMSFTILIIRWIGKRAIGTLGSADILLIIAMGSSVGDAMLYPSIPLILPILVIALIAAFQKLYVIVGVKYAPARKITHPSVLKLVEHGRVMIENLSADVIDEDEVYMLLRQEGIKYLSEVEHAYYEQSGALSVYRYDDPLLEHSILPEHLNN